MNQIINIKLKKVVDNLYPVLLGSGSVKKLPMLIKKIGKIEQVVIITDSNVKKVGAKEIVDNLNKAGYKSNLLFFAAGEKSKIQTTISHLQSEMFKRGCGRGTLIVALGGGVVGDIAGFVAATYMRGIPFVQIPTTLLAMVDSSIGGKTGFDTGYGKNLIGAFYQPRAVLIDFNFLKTLPRQQLINGLVEAIKIFLVSDLKMFNFVEKNLEKILSGEESIIYSIVSRSIQLKTQVVERDEKENGERMILNFGHTLGHAFEVASNYKLSHGEAVALGMIAEARIANQLSLLDFRDTGRIETIIKKLGIEVSVLKKFNVNKLLKIMKSDKKGAGQFVLLKKLGEVSVLSGKYTQKVDELIIKRVLI